MCSWLQVGIWQAYALDAGLSEEEATNCTLWSADDLPPQLLAVNATFSEWFMNEYAACVRPTCCLILSCQLLLDGVASCRTRCLRVRACLAAAAPAGRCAPQLPQAPPLCCPPAASSTPLA